MGGLILLALACGEPATLTAVQEQVFTPSCAFSSCHGDVEAGDLRLDGDAWAALVDVESAQVAGVSLVAPGAPDDSYIIWKMEGHADIEGDPMPPAGGLTDEQLDLVREWIEGGALDD